MNNRSPVNENPKKDVFLFSGEISISSNIELIDLISKEKKSDKLLLILVTYGGSPESAYKIGKFLQSQYSDITIYVPGYCKSAGTLLVGSRIV